MRMKAGDSVQVFWSQLKNFKKSFEIGFLHYLHVFLIYSYYLLGFLLHLCWKLRKIVNYVCCQFSLIVGHITFSLKVRYPDFLEVLIRFFFNVCRIVFGRNNGFPQIMWNVKFFKYLWVIFFLPFPIEFLEKHYNSN